MWIKDNSYKDMKYQFSVLAREGYRIGCLLYVCIEIRISPPFISREDTS